MPRKPGPRSWGERIKLFVCGFGMGAADLVPGISGGTVAFITGIYEDLLDSISSFNGRAIKQLLTLRWAEFFKGVAWEFLVTLFFGIFVAMACLSQAIHAMLGDPVLRTYLFATFVGLVLASALFCAKQVTQWHAKQVVALLGGVVVAFVITSLPKNVHEDGFVYDVAVKDIALAGDFPALDNYDAERGRLLGVDESTLSAMWAKGFVSGDTVAYSYEQEREAAVSAFVHPKSTTAIDLWLLGCGAIAACAMLLPGISGSYILTVLGVYTAVIGNLADLMHGLRGGELNVDAFFALSSVAIGALLGIALFARVIAYLLRHYHNSTVAVLTGFMLGALRAVWPFWTYTYYLAPLRLERGAQLRVVEPVLPDFTSSVFWVALLCVVLGLAVVVIAEKVVHRGAPSEKETTQRT